MAVGDEISTVESLMQLVQSNSPEYGFFYHKHLKQDHSGHSFYVNCDEVYPNIFIGDGTTAKHKDYLKKIGITHVLNTAEGKNSSMVDTDKYYYEDVGIKYLGFSILDHPTFNISKYFHEAADFIENALKECGKVFVHCLMGMSRSSTCVLAYLMLKKGMSAIKAIRTVTKKRAIYPNRGFLQQLVDLDNILKKTKRNWNTLNY